MIRKETIKSNGIIHFFVQLPKSRGQAEKALQMSFNRKQLRKKNIDQFMVNCYLIIIYFISEAPLWVCLSFTQYPTDSRRKVLQFGVRVHAEIIRIQTNKINYYFFPSIFNNKKFEKKEIHMRYLFIKTYDKK